jgi:hypothetical protein
VRANCGYGTAQIVNPLIHNTLWICADAQTARSGKTALLKSNLIPATVVFAQQLPNHRYRWGICDIRNKSEVRLRMTADHSVTTE